MSTFPTPTHPTHPIPSHPIPEDGVVPLQVLPEQRPAQRAWTGLVTSMACALLAAGRVDAVLCVASADEESPEKRLEPRPILARTVEEAGEGLGMSWRWIDMMIFFIFFIVVSIETSISKGFSMDFHGFPWISNCNV